MKTRLAIIGASTGQLPLCLKAREMGLETYCFAWPDGAVCKDYVDHFIPISILEMDEIVRRCKNDGVEGVVSNASEMTAAVAAYVAEKLGKNTTPYDKLRKIQDKSYVRNQTNKLSVVSPVNYAVGKIDDVFSAIRKPFVLKPIKGASKIGVNFIDERHDVVEIPDNLRNKDFLAEEYIEGKEYSVESLSYHGCHQVVQITEKISSGPPHFVELEHHQPAQLPQSCIGKIECAISEILTAIEYTEGASHTEIKIDEKGEIHLIEVNPRGGGDMISNKLIELSTDFDYIKNLIAVSIGSYEKAKPHNIAYAGIYFLTALTSRLMPYFRGPMEMWMIERKLIREELTQSRSNYDHDGYIIYKSDKKIIL